MITVDCISKYFGGYSVLDNMSARFADSGFYLLLGESGSGKTTFLNILYGLIPFDNGRVIVGNKEYKGKVDLYEISQYSEYITQDPFFVSYLSMLDNLRLVTDEEDEILVYTERFHLADQLKQRPDMLSGGEKERFAIVRALLQKKRILFLDEPTAALDELNKREVFTLLKELKGEMLIICASHDQIASQYADSIIAFIKSDSHDTIQSKMRTNIVALSNEERKHKDRIENKSKSLPMLIKWFGYKSYRERIVLIFFLTIAFCLIMFADVPEKKINAAKNYLYKINVLPVTVINHKRWEDLDLPRDGVRQVVLDYAGSCPDGNEEVDLDNGMGFLPQYEYENVLTIPFSAEEFMLSDRIEYGTYFTSEDQIILTHEMAVLLNPSDMENLIGKKCSKNYYGLGKVDLEIVGILGELSEKEKAYMDLYTDNRDFYSDYYFVNSRLTDKLEHDDSFYYITRINGRRVYHLYFDTYYDLMKYYEENSPAAGSNNDYVFTPEIGFTEGKVRTFFDMVFPVMLPLAVLLAVMAVLYYVQIRKMEYDHNHQFISVFEYNGYNKKKVINSFIMLNNLEFIISMVIALVIAFALTALTNMINQAVCLIPFVIFTYNPIIILSFIFGVTAIGSLSTWIQYSRVNIFSWYEDLIDTRDLI